MKVPANKNLIRSRLDAAQGRWVSARDLSQIAIEYTRPIHELRRDGLTIENQTVWVRGKCHGYYRIPRYPGQPAPALPETPSINKVSASVPTPAQSAFDLGTHLAWETGRVRR